MRFPSPAPRPSTRASSASTFLRRCRLSSYRRSTEGVWVGANVASSTARSRSAACRKRRHKSPSSAENTLSLSTRMTPASGNKTLMDAAFTPGRAAIGTSSIRPSLATRLPRPLLHQCGAWRRSGALERVHGRLGAVAEAVHHGIVLRQELRHEHGGIDDSEGDRVRAGVGKARNRLNDACVVDRILDRGGVLSGALRRVLHRFGDGIHHLIVCSFTMDTYSGRGNIHDRLSQFSKLIPT